MHGLHSRYPEEKNKMIAVNHKLLEQDMVVAKEVNFHKHKLLDLRTCCSYGSGMDVFVFDTWDWYLLLLLNLENFYLCLVVGGDRNERLAPFIDFNFRLASRHKLSKWLVCTLSAVVYS